jgi:hypothetical protein
MALSPPFVVRVEKKPERSFREIYERHPYMVGSPQDRAHLV